MLGIYTRLSREHEDSNSIEHQINEGISFANSNGLSYKLFNEGEGVSGTLQIEDRPILFDLVSQVKDGKITHVWMRNQNRLARDENTYHGFIYQMIKYKVKVYFDNKLMDFNNPSQSLMGSILSSINTYQAKLQSYQTKKVLQKNAIEGKAHGILPYGYCTNINGLLMIDEEESEIVKRIYAMSLRGIGTNKIAQILSDEGVLTRYNKMEKGGTLTTKNKYTKKETTKKKSDIKWSGKTVGNIIKSTLYYGERTFGGKKHKCPAIFEKKYWEKVNDNLTKNRNNSGKKVNHKYMLKGVIECGRCGRNMYGRTRTNKKDNYYMCSGKRYKNWDCDTRSINIDILEDFIWSRFFEKQELLKVLKEYFNRDSTAIKKIDSSISFQNSRIKNLTKEKEKAIELVIKGVLSENEVVNAMNRINNNIDEVQDFIFRLKEQKKAFSQSNEMLAQLKALSENLKLEDSSTPKRQMAKHLNLHLSKEQSLKGVSFYDKSAIIRQYIKRIKVTSDDELKLYNISISFTIDQIEPQNFVMNYFKRVPYINSLESIQVLYKSTDWKGRYRKDLYKLDNYQDAQQLADDTQIISDTIKKK